MSVPGWGPIDYEALVDLFMDPEAGLPKDLLDALFLVDEMATPHGMDALLNTPGLALEDSDDDSPADIAVQAWLLDRHFLESKHAELFLVRPRSFECYQTGRINVPPFTLPDAAVCGNLERDLDDWFEQKKRDRGTRVFVYPRVEVHRAEEVFEAFRSRNGKPPDGARIVRAVFQVKFSDSKRPRSVTIRPSNIAHYTRDDDAELVEQWLGLRGFILAGSHSGKGAGYATLASA